MFFFCIAEGKVFTWGKAGPYLGYSVENGSNKQLMPRLVDALEREKIIHLACGRLHTLGLCYTQCCCHVVDTRMLSLSLLLLLLSFSLCHCLSVSLCLSLCLSVSLCLCLSLSSVCLSVCLSLCLCLSVSVSLSLSGCLSVCLSHSLPSRVPAHSACSDSGHVFSFGVNKFGELGLGHDREVIKPALIPELQTVYRVACGRHHSAAIDGE